MEYMVNVWNKTIDESEDKWNNLINNKIIWLKNLLFDVEKETNVIVSCSLLKKSYRDFFIKGSKLKFVN